MTEKNIVFKKDKYRIVEIEDFHFELESLKGDCFNPDVNTDIDPIELKKQELEFESKVECHGVFGYALEIWDEKIDMGWTHIDSCFGFIGRYDPKIEEFNHYIIEELKGQINESNK